MTAHPDDPACIPDAPAALTPASLPPAPTDRVASPCEKPIEGTFSIGFEMRPVITIILDTEFTYTDEAGDRYVDESGNAYLG